MQQDALQDARPELAIASRRLVTPEGERAGAVLIAGGTIVGVVEPGEIPPGCRVVDAGARAVMAGVVDSHVHVNEPGRSDWEGFRSATRAAAAGGVTTLVDMPLNSLPVTTDVAALERKRAAARGQIVVDCGFYGGLVPGSAGEVAALLEAGVCGVKAFLVDSGIPEFPPVAEADLRAAMPVLVRYGAPLLVHAELAGPAVVPAGGARSYRRYLASRPADWEVRAIELLIELCRETGCAVHVVHLAAAEALPAIAAARREGLPLTVETCPHYLCFAAEEIPDGDTRFKCAPPLRGRENRERLWRALGEGLIDLVASDHSPSPPALKLLAEGDLERAWGGVSSLQLSLSATWTEARRRGFGLDEVAGWMCRKPARLAGLDDRKGELRAGLDADLVIWDPEAELAVEAAKLYHRHPVTPYEGRRLRGVVLETWVRGRKLFDREGGSEPFSAAAAGKMLRRRPSEAGTR